MARIPHTGRQQPTRTGRELQQELRRTQREVEANRDTEAAKQGTTLGATVLFPLAIDPPSGFWRANGQTPLRQRLPELFAEIGEGFGAGDGATTFALPDLGALEPGSYGYWIYAGRPRD